MSEMDEFKAEVRDQIKGLRTDIRELTMAFRDLIRIDTNLKNVDRRVDAIGASVDDHETRLRAIEVSGSGEKQRINHTHWFVNLLISAVVSGAIALLYRMT